MPTADTTNRPDVHAIFCTFNDGKQASFSCTHIDNTDAIEDWSAVVPIGDALKIIDGWDPALLAAASYFPNVIDWKLSWRGEFSFLSTQHVAQAWEDPLPTWLSKSNKITLLGDSAHSFLPTSIQGASQAWEDGVLDLLATAKVAGYLFCDRLSLPFVWLWLEGRQRMCHSL